MLAAIGFNRSTALLSASEFPLNIPHAEPLNLQASDIVFRGTMEEDIQVGADVLHQLDSFIVQVLYFRYQVAFHVF